MTGRGRWLALAALVVLGGWLFFRFSASDERRIGRRLDRLQELVAKVPGESRLEGLQRARRIAELFAEPFAVEAPAYGFDTSDRQRLAAGIHQYRAGSRTIGMRITGHDLAVDRRLRRATSHLTAHFVTGLDDLRGREAYRLQLNWAEQDGEWRIDYARLLEVLQPGDR